MGAIGEGIGAIVSTPLQALGIIPKPPKVQKQEDPAVAYAEDAKKAATAAERALLASRQASASGGRASTILTGGNGLGTPNTTDANRILLG